MSLQSNTIKLQAILAAVGALLEAGGGGAKVAYGTFTLSGRKDTYTITHNLGVVPQIAFCIADGFPGVWETEIGLFSLVGFAAGIMENDPLQLQSSAWHIYEPDDEGDSRDYGGTNSGSNQNEMTGNEGGFCQATDTTIKIDPWNQSIDDEYSQHPDLYDLTYFWVVIGGIE